MTGLKLLCEFFRFHRLPVAGVVVLDIFAGIFTILLPLIIAQLLAEVFSFQSARGAMIEQLGIPLTFTLQQWIWLFFTIILVKFSLDFFKKKQKGELTELLLFWLREKLFRQQLKMDIRVYEEKGTGKYLLRFSGDLSSVKNFVSKGILQFFADGVLMIIGMVFICWLDWQLSVIIVTVLLILGVVVAFLNRKIGQVEEQRRNKKSGLLAFVSNRLLHIATLRAFNKITPELYTFQTKARKVKEWSVSYYRWASLIDALVPLAIYSILVLLFVVISMRQESMGTLANDALFAVVLILLSWRSTIRRVFRIGLVWKKGKLSLDKLAVLFDRPVEKGWQRKSIHCKGWRLQLENVSLKLRNKMVFHQLTFDLEVGQRALIKGASGSGKSTLVKLLAGLYQPDQGELLLANQSMQQFSPKQCRKKMTFVSDLFPLYGKNIIEAISYSKRTQDKTALLFADWQRLFPQLAPLSLVTVVHDTSCLSAAQQQLLLWLRAISTRKKIFILDEPFKNLNQDSAIKLWQQLPTQSSVLLLSAEDWPSFAFDWEIDLENIQKKHKKSASLGNISTNQ
ncbi:MAG: ABC transporter ATP-binding protein [Bacteroidota bacterium]